MAVNLLLSYAFHGQRKMNTRLDAVRRELVCGRLMLDSGAFTAFTAGTPIDLVEYAEWLERWRDCWDHAVTLDVIGDPVATRRQTKRLHVRGLPVMPVFTMGDNLAEFDAMVAECRYVCVGGLVRKGFTKAARDRTAMLQRRAAAAGGGIHALGVGNTEALRLARPYSADASVVSAAFLFGNVVYWDGRKVQSLSLRARRTQLVADRDHITGQDIPLGSLLRTGRLPGGAARDVLVAGYGLTYAVADEVLKRAPVPGPGGAPPGPHLYSSITPSYAVMPSAALDRRLHEGYRPAAWGRYGARHTCPRVDTVETG